MYLSQIEHCLYLLQIEHCSYLSQIEHCLYLLQIEHCLYLLQIEHCLYLSQIDPLRILNISNLNECINFEVNIANKICRFTQLNRSPSQKQEESQAFKSSLDMNLDPLSTINPFHYDWRFQCEIKELILK